MKYSNTDCLNNPITDLAPVSFKGKISGNNCATFNGSSDYINFGNTFLYQRRTDVDDTGSISLQVMFPSSISSSSNNLTLLEGILGLEDQELPIASSVFRLFYKPSNNTFYIHPFATGMVTYTASISICDDKWHTLYVHINNPGHNGQNDVSLYIDGVKQTNYGTNSDGNAKIFASAVGVKTGSTNGSSLSNYFKGSICNLKIYNSSLTENEINNCVLYTGDKLIHWYPLAEGSNTIAYDAAVDWNNPDPNMGAKVNGGWDITEQPSSTTTRGSWTCPGGTYSSVLYCKSYENMSGLPEGNTSAVELQSKYAIQESGAWQNFHINSFSLYPEYSDKTINVHLRFWYKKLNNESGEIAVGYNSTAAFLYITSSSITDTDWHLVDKIITVKPSDMTNIAHGRIGIAAKYTHFLITGFNISISEGNVNGRIYSTGITTFWNTKQNVFAYSAINGFKQDSLLDTSIVSAKSPQDQQIVVYKSDFLTGNDNWGGYGVQTTLTRSDNILHAARIYESGTRVITIRNNGLGLNINQLGRNFHVKAKLVNRYSLPIQNIEVTIGTTYGTPGYGLASLKLGSEANPLNIGQDEEYIINGDTEIQNGNGFDNLFRIGVYYKNNITEAFSIDISDIELTQINNTTTYPAISNGIPPCESNLDYSQGVSNVAELKNVSFATTLKPYPKIWYKSNFSSSIDGWSNYGYDTTFSYDNNTLIYTLPASNTNTYMRFNHSVPSGFTLSNNFNTGTWHLKCTITNNSESNFSGDETLGISIGSYYGADGVASYSYSKTSSSPLPILVIGGSTTLDIDIPNKSSVIHFDANLLIQLYFTNGIIKDTTIERKIVLSDIEISYTPTSDTYAPIYTKITENGSIQNPLVYKKAQTGINLDRIKNKLKHS